MQAHHRLSRIMLCLTVGLANAAWAYPEYRVTVVGPANSYATDINKDGVVTGDYYINGSSPRGFFNRGKGVVYLGTFGGTSSNAVAINDKGQILGQWTTTAGQVRGLIYYAGTRRDIGIIPGHSTRYTDINNGGFIIAQGTREGMVGPRSFLRAPDGKLTDIGTLPFDDPIAYASAINNHNTIAGASGPLTFPDQPLRAFTWSQGVMRDLGDFGFAPNYGEAINDCGQITGSMSVPYGPHNRIAYLYTNGRMIDLDGRPVSAERDSAGAGINCHGHVVGSSNHLSGFVYRGRRMQSLNALIDPALHWDIFSPQAINDAGQIAANAMRHGVQYAVRLDLIRPMTARVPELEADAATLAPAISEAEAKAEAQAQAREVVHPVQQ
ncbi:HAF repeat-containing protein [Massilia sp. TSP1-1-2]|uniref:HAF repeat-containing protein n=1 Tax=Massilia sp. TSP1-1-2 TaxID=2804649 RepID=UPI003CEB252F